MLTLVVCEEEEEDEEEEEGEVEKRKKAEFIGKEQSRSYG